MQCNQLASLLTDLREMDILHDRNQSPGIEIMTLWGHWASSWSSGRLCDYHRRRSARREIHGKGRQGGPATG